MHDEGNKLVSGYNILLEQIGHTCTHGWKWCSKWSCCKRIITSVWIFNLTARYISHNVDPHVKWAVRKCMGPCRVELFVSTMLQWQYINLTFAFARLEIVHGNCETWLCCDLAWGCANCWRVTMPFPKHREKRTCHEGDESHNIDDKFQNKDF